MRQAMGACANRATCSVMSWPLCVKQAGLSAPSSPHATHCAALQLPSACACSLRVRPQLPAAGQRQQLQRSPPALLPRGPCPLLLGRAARATPSTHPLALLQTMQQHPSKRPYSCGRIALKGEARALTTSTMWDTYSAYASSMRICHCTLLDRRLRSLSGAAVVVFPCTRGRAGRQAEQERCWAHGAAWCVGAGLQLRPASLSLANQSLARRLGSCWHWRWAGLSAWQGAARTCHLPQHSQSIQRLAAVQYTPSPLLAAAARPPLPAPVARLRCCHLHRARRRSAPCRYCLPWPQQRCPR